MSTNTKTQLEVYSELQTKMQLIQQLMNSSENMSVCMKIENLHVVELFELKTWLESLGDKLKHQTIELRREGERFVIYYRPQPKALLRIYSNYINKN